MASGNILSFYWGYSSKIVCMWLAIWAIRKRADADFPLDRSARIVRWAMVAVGFGIGYYVPGPGFEGYIRVGGFFLGMAFLCWPNFAHHLRNLFRRGGAPQHIP